MTRAETPKTTVLWIGAAPYRHHAARRRPGRASAFAGRGRDPSGSHRL